MRKIKLIYLLCIVLLFGCAGASREAETVAEPVTRASAKPMRASPDYSNIGFTPWTAAKLPTRGEKPYTLMIYMNGSDLESESGAATYNLMQMLESGLNSANANIVIFTGGTKRWQNDLVPPNECMLWEIADGEIIALDSVGLLNMGDPGTLSSFIDYGIDNFPAARFGLIMWDHGGGSIAGFGHDEKFNNSTLTLLDMNYAFEKSKLSGMKLELLGFDSCLMSTVEMAVVAADYAKYMIASEDLSPGDGWDYSFLRALNDNPGMDGAALGAVITDSYMDYYGAYADDILNISVVDLSRAGEVMSAMGDLMSRCSQSLLENASAFRTLARRRSGTRAFGLGSPRDNESDMVDLGDMAYKLADLFPDEAESLFTALDNAVINNRNNSGVYLGGLSTYYVYNGKDKESLDIYGELNMDSEYTEYLHRFFNNLSGRKYRSGGETRVMDVIDADLTAWKPAGEHLIMTGIKYQGAYDAAAKNEPWPKINGREVCLYMINTTSEGVLYAAPATVNGRDCDVVVLISEKYPQGKILGARNEDGYVIQKGYDPINDGERIGFYYERRNPASETAEGWQLSDEFTVEGGLTLEWSQSSPDTQYKLRLTDVWNSVRFVEL